ncbi:MAG: NUDIX domain-containing protein [Erysipelotrichaceae bacterium]|nr:NUDIX domain-containing protein [Erysipelotrichaceae bacterium]
MHRLEKCRLTNMCLLESEGKYLVQVRTKEDWPGLTFPGGHVEPGESLREAMIREFREETGLTLLDPLLKGIEEFRTEEEDRYFIFFYKATRYEGEIASSGEGEIFWIPKEDFGKYPPSLDIEDILRVIEDDSISELRYYWENGEWKHCLE